MPRFSRVFHGFSCAAKFTPAAGATAYQVDGYAKKHSLARDASNPLPSVF
jgi:hypothetical protein